MQRQGHRGQSDAADGSFDAVTRIELSADRGLIGPFCSLAPMALTQPPLDKKKATTQAEKKKHVLTRAAVSRATQSSFVNFCIFPFFFLFFVSPSRFARV